jgi:aspartate racemase
MSNGKIIGVLGGMGPQASCELYRLVNEKSCAKGRLVRNADFPHLLLNSIPVPDLISDRDAERKTISMVRKGAFALERAGATDILMACNTMHLHQEAITEGLSARFHSLIDIVADSMKKARKILLLGSRTTIETGLYQKALDKRGVRYLVPSNRLLDQSVETILATIGQVITPTMIGAYVDAVLSEARQDSEIDAIGLVCTELPLIFPLNAGEYRITSSLHQAAEFLVALQFDG